MSGVANFFSRPGDLKRHKCLDEQGKQQSMSSECPTCERWFGSVRRNSAAAVELAPSM